MRTRLASLFLMAAVALWACDAGDGETGSPDASTADVHLGDVGAGDVGEEPWTWEPVEPHVEQRGQFTLVWLSGTAYEMGVQQGELLYDTIAEAMEFVANDALLSSLPVLAESLGIKDIALANSYPDILDECQGMIDAAGDTGFDMTYCLALNFGDVMLEMIETGVPEADQVTGPGCSGAIVRGNATPDGVLRHTRNLDWGSMDIAIIHEHPVLFVRQPSDGIPHVYVGFPMNLSPYTGMNLAGISIGSHEASPVGIEELSRTGRSHVQMVGQLLKSASSLEEARAFVTSQEHMSVETLVVADGDGGDGAVFEMTALALAERSPEDDILYATNHFVHPDMVAHHAAPGAGSLGRFERFGQLLPPDGVDSLYGQLDESGLAQVMRDTLHPGIGHVLSDAEMEAENWDIDGALGVNGPMHFVIFRPADRLFWVAAGEIPIHQHSYYCFSLEELLGYPEPAACDPAEIPAP